VTNLVAPSTRRSVSNTGINDRDVDATFGKNIHVRLRTYCAPRTSPGDT